MVSCNNNKTEAIEENSKCEQQCSEQKNQVVDCIMSRRSIRAYKPEQIKDEELKTILECAINAPSARNSQPWEVRVMQNKDAIENLNKEVIADMIEKRPEAKERFADENASVFFHAPTLLVVAYDTTQYWGQSDCGMLVQNVLLAAESMNIGSCAVGCCREYINSPKAADFVKSLNLPENYVVYLTVTLGYKDENPDAKPRDDKKVAYME
ncbi:MAG: nitroreductase [Bacteroidales bacterium]|nr:nitroreductase [Bacteroidales bacterium]